MQICTVLARHILRHGRQESVEDGVRIVLNDKYSFPKIQENRLKQTATMGGYCENLKITLIGEWKQEGLAS